MSFTSTMAMNPQPIGASFPTSPVGEFNPYGYMSSPPGVNPWAGANQAATNAGVAAGNWQAANTHFGNTIGQGYYVAPGGAWSSSPTASMYAAQPQSDMAASYGSIQPASSRSGYTTQGMGSIYDQLYGGMGYPALGYGISPAAGYSAWDPQATGYKMAMGQLTPSPALQTQNMWNVANYANNSGLFQNPAAGWSLANMAYAESGANPYAVENAQVQGYPYGPGQGMFQWTSPSRQGAAIDAGVIAPHSYYQMNSPSSFNPMYWSSIMPQGLSPANYGWPGDIASPQSQTSMAMYEIASNPQYAGLYRNMNNPNVSLGQLNQQMVSQYEAPAPGYPTTQDLQRAYTGANMMGLGSLWGGSGAPPSRSGYGVTWQR